ncbi:MAG: type II toxin-antitoxin system RelE family toxin [Candidatus Eiseniibacteriota bacterium]
MPLTREYTIEVAKSVQWSIPMLGTLKDRAQIAERIDALARIPRPAGAKRIDCGIPNVHRIGYGRHMILYQVLDEDMRIVVLAIGEA